MFARLWAAYRLELRQIFRQWSYWVIQALLVVYIVSTFGNNSFFTAQELLWAGASRNVIGVGALMTLIFGVFSAGRAQRNRMNVVEAALPVGVEVQMGRWLALVTAIQPFFLSGLVVAWMAGPPESFWHALPVYLLESTLTFTFTASLVWLLVVMWGARRWMFVLAVMLWVASIFTIMLSNVPVLNLWTGMLNFTRFGYGAFSPVWERLQQGEFPDLMNGFYLGMTLLLFGLMLYVVQRRRFYRMSAPVTGVISVGVVIGLVSAALYGAHFARARADMIDYREETYPYMFYGGEQPTPVVDSAVSRYDIRLDVTGTPLFTVEMDVVNLSAVPLDELAFALVTALTVTEVSLPYTHADNRLILRPDTPLPAGETLTVRLVYGGDLALYTHIWGAVPEMNTFIMDAGISLYPTAAWYPRAGDGISETAVIPAHIRLEVTGAKVPMVSNLDSRGDGVFESDAASTLWLGGARLLRIFEPVAGVRVVATETVYARLKGRLEADFGYTAPTMKQYFPDVYVIGSPWARWSPYQMNRAYEMAVYGVISNLLGDTFSFQLTENIAQFVWLQVEYDTPARMRDALTRQRTASDARGLEADMPYFAPAGVAGSYAVAGKLIDVYEAHGVAVAAPLVAAMRAEYATLSPLPSLEIVAWIDAWLAENTDDV